MSPGRGDGLRWSASGCATTCRPVQCADHAAQRCLDDRLADADAPQHGVAHLDLQVGGGLSVPPGAERVLGVVEHPYVHAAQPEVDAGQRRAERRDGAVPAARQGVLGAEGAHRRGDALDALLTHRAELDQLEGAGLQVLVGEDLPHLRRVHLAARIFGVPLDHVAELDLQAPRQVQMVVALHDVGHAALAGLRIDPDDGLVGPAYVPGVDGQVRHSPWHLADRLARLRGDPLQVVEALLDRVLVRAGERRVDQIAGVRMALMDIDAGAVLGGAADLVDVAEVDHRVDALAVEVQPERHQVDVARPLAVAEQAPLDPLRPGQHRQLGIRGRGAPVVMGVHRQGDVLAPAQVPAHPLDLVGVDIGGGALDGARQVEHDLAVRAWLPYLHHRLADLQREIELGVHEDLRRVLIAEVGARQVGLGELHDRPGAFDRDGPALGPPVAVPAEHHPPEDRRGRVVHVHGGLPGAGQRLDGALDQLLTGLGQHRDADVVRYRAGLDQAADEVELGLAGGREADLDLLVPHPYQQVEHGALAGRVHRVDQGLVAVPQVGRQPPRRRGDRARGPLPVGQVDRAERLVAVTGHAGRALISWITHDAAAPDEDGPDFNSVGAAQQPAARSRPAGYLASPRPRRSSLRIMIWTG